MRIRTLLEAMESIAPLWYAEDWDNVGLLIGEPDDPCDGPILFTIDCTHDVVAEACDLGASMIVSYHPPIFGPLKRIAGPDERARVVLQACRAGLCVYSPHTALDATKGGVTDWLCNTLGPSASGDATFGDRRAIEPLGECAPSERCKIVTFVPEEAVDRIRDAMASAGAGRIGEYELCSFRVGGTGSFRSTGDARPTGGRAGVLEHVPEMRLEMVCAKKNLALAGEMLRQFHPYEEPAWEIYSLMDRPNRSRGAGRLVTLDQSVTTHELAMRVKSALGVDAVKLASVSDEPVQRIGVCPGSGASLLDGAIAAGCTMFLTGEMRHHEVLEAIERGCSVLLAGHTNSERGFLPEYAARVKELVPDAETVVSTSDRTLFHTL
ncbi:MAG: Nif3-like dinuclear metal center hexameric protein [Planctomycetota bacterium]|jgi:dinuclear metal center YbgI/SA1388 family protein